MSLTTIIYLADISKSISGVFVLASLFSFIFIPYQVIRNAICIDMGKEPKEVKLKFAVFLGCLLMALSSVIPSKAAIYEITAVQIGQEIATSPKVEALTSKVYKIIDAKLDELQPKPKESK